MAAKKYKCSECGEISSFEMMMCSVCGKYNSYELVKAQDEKNVSKVAQRLKSTVSTGFTSHKAVKLGDINITAQNRYITPMGEFNRVLGGGVVPGSIILLGGVPGIGKTTLLSYLATSMSQEKPVIYATAEESDVQVKMRSDRLGLKAEHLYIFSESCLERILEQVEEIGPHVLIIDSIQTMYSEEIEGNPGGTKQLQECAHRLQMLAKKQHITVFLIGHVTKDGDLAGPKKLEHLVDTVLYLEGDAFQMYRLLRTTKNRFGATNEIGVFEMTSKGFEEVANPSAAFLSERDPKASGTTVTVAMEGTRPILVEVQALANRANGPSYRTINGVDQGRAQIALGVIAKSLDIDIYAYNIIVSVIGGLYMQEPSVDLAMIASVYSTIKDVPFPSTYVAFGEVDLPGKVRSVQQAQARINEAAKLGFEGAVVPMMRKGGLVAPKKFDLVQIENLQGLADFMDQKSGGKIKKSDWKGNGVVERMGNRLKYEEKTKPTFRERWADENLDDSDEV